MRAWLRDMREGARILTTRDFWRTFADYWHPTNVAARIDAWTGRRTNEENRMTDIRTDTNLVEVVTVRTRPDQDPDEPIIGEVHIWEAEGDIHVEAIGAGHIRMGAGRL